MVLHASIALRVMQFSSELLTPQQPPLGASSPFMALGGVLSIELMALPQPPKKVKGWTIRPVAEAGVPIVRQSYPTPAAGGDGMSGSAPPLRITFTVAPTVLLPEGTPRVGGWDADAGSWKVEGISEIEVNAETRAVSFVTPRLTALALTGSVRPARPQPPRASRASRSHRRARPLLPTFADRRVRSSRGGEAWVPAKGNARARARRVAV